jgi:cytochrome c oxidase subunit 2
MVSKNQAAPRRILIASSHPLFAQGLRSLLHKRQKMDAIVVGMVSTIDEALEAINSLHPDMVIVDYDDERVNRDEFLARFVEGEGRMRVVLLSLREGGDEAIVYDRRTLAASQVDDWMEMWTEPQPEGEINQEEHTGKAAKPRRRDSMRHLIIAGIFVVLIMIAGFFFLRNVDLLPIAASLQAGSIDSLFGLQFAVIVGLFSLIVGLVVYSILFFRRRKDDTTDGPHVEGNTTLEVAWTLIPLGFVLYLAYLGGVSLGKTQAADPKPLEVKVVGSQWAWRFEYPRLGIISTELILPVDKQALLELTSTDVIHSFWVPQFRVKQDALPGEGFERDLRVTPNEIGEYSVVCAELCGRQHYAMTSPVKVLSQPDFDAWVQSNTTSASADPVERGDQLSQQFGCRACHSVDGTVVVGPSWKGIFGKQEPLVDGTSALVDEAYIIDSIHNPGAKITAGFQNLMPANVGAQLTDEQISDIVEFIKSLK